MDKQIIEKIVKDSLQEATKGSFQKREIFDKAKQVFELPHILSLIGVRRCGKSTLMKLLVRQALKKTVKQNILYLNLEQPFFNQYKNDVKYLEQIYNIFKETCNAKKPLFIFLDEIQFFADWQVFVKALYEKKEAKIVLTGSNSRLLSSELATLLSGRTIPLHVYPFSLQESKLPLETYIEDGGFPEIIRYPEQKKTLIEAYYKNILYQDVIPRFDIKNSLAMENLSFYLISNIGKELSYNTLKNISKLDDKTIKEYIQHLQDANLLYLIHNYDYSLKKLIGNKKKIYLVDPAFTQLAFKHSPDHGRLFENFIYMLLKRAENEIYFHKNGAECDFILKEGIKITTAIQVCHTLTEENLEREIKGVLSAMQKFSIAKGYIIIKNTEINKKEFAKQHPNIEILSAKEAIKKFGIHSEK